MLEHLIEHTPADGSTDTPGRFQADALQQDTLVIPFGDVVYVTMGALNASPLSFGASRSASIST